jgi:hypothetical protein
MRYGRGRWCQTLKSRTWKSAIRALCHGQVIRILCSQLGIGGLINTYYNKSSSKNSIILSSVLINYDGKRDKITNDLRITCLLLLCWFLTLERSLLLRPGKVNDSTIILYRSSLLNSIRIAWAVTGVFICLLLRWSNYSCAYESKFINIITDLKYTW